MGDEIEKPVTEYERNESRAHPPRAEASSFGLDRLEGASHDCEKGE